LGVIRFPLIISAEKVIEAGKLFPTLTAVHMDCNYSHVAPDVVLCLPKLFEETKLLRVLTMETPCSVDIAVALTTHCGQLQQLSITVDSDVDLVCQEIVKNFKYLQSFKILLLDGASLTSSLNSNSIQDFNFSRELSFPCCYSLPEMQFPQLRTLLYRVCYISEQYLLYIAKTCPGLLSLDMRCCITGPRSSIESGLQALWDSCRELHTIETPPWI
jgi:hypothetical protein